MDQPTNDQLRNHMLHMLVAQLQDNRGQRLTDALINGLCTTLDATWPRFAEPAPVAPEPATPKKKPAAQPG
jgi:hypothetical protein